MSKIEEIIEQIQTVLKLGPVEVVGIDIGQSAVRVAEVSIGKKGNLKLEKFAYKFLPEGCLIEDEILQPDEVVNAINECFAKTGIKNKQICIGLSGPNTMSKRLQVADGTDEEITDQVTWESEQYIPFGAEESILSHSVLDKNPGGGVDVMVAAAKKDIIDGYGTLIKSANLKLKIVDLDLFALANIFEALYEDKIKKEKDGILVIDFGAQKTNILIFHKGTVVFTREMSIGGVVITEEVQRQMSLSYNEAEDLKISGDESGNIPEEIAEIIKVNLENFLAEIKKTLTFFMTAANDVTLGSCYITGGASLTPGFLEGLESTVGVPIVQINPFERMSYNEKDFDEIELNYVAACGCIALGLAIRRLRK
ncbi:MAG: type IV pilus assembly protein PilM [Oligoflexia bacterium]|nr:type IV pilus assembly protein PilM [Oligoflexia bacterium]